MLADFQTPNFSTKVRGEICETVMHQAKKSIELARPRDDDFLTWNAQAEGDPWWAGIQPRWQGGCDIEDPITSEQEFEIVAALLYVQQQEDPLIVTEKATGDEESASNVEAVLNDAFEDADFYSVHLYDLLCYATRMSYGVLYTGWGQTYRKEYTPVYRHKRSREIVPEHDVHARENPDDYDITEHIQEIPEDDGIVMRATYSGDVYLWPPSAQSFQTAEAVIERFEYTEHDLLNGIDGYGFDEKQVEELFKQGPTKFSDRTYQRERNEVEGSYDEQETWEVLMVTGRAPGMVDRTDGRSKLKPSERNRDFQWMLGPAHNICFKFAPSMYAKRPYAKYPFRERPGRWVGHSLCSMLSPLQQEATLSFRNRIDFRDLFMSNPLLVPDEMYDQLSQWKMYPGALIPYSTNAQFGGPGSIVPVTYNPAGYEAYMKDSMDCRGRAQQMFSADARGPAENQRATATERTQAAAGADEKLNLLLHNLHKGIRETGDIVLSHIRQFRGQESQDVRVKHKTITVTPEMLTKRYRIQATGNSENANPIVRLQRAEMLANFAKSDPILARSIGRGDYTGAYAVMERLYHACHIRNPQTILGLEPKAPPDPEMVLEAIMQIAMRFAQQGDQGASFIVQKVRQMMQSGEGGGNQGHEQRKQDIRESISFKDLAPNQKDAMAQMAGLPPAKGQGAPQETRTNGNGMAAPQQAMAA